MAGFALSSRLDWFPEGTSVGAYLPAQRRPYMRQSPLASAAPEGAAVESQTVTSGVATFAALSALAAYELYAVVGGQHRYLSVRAGA
jgi:hypothetical protein